jgi:DNA-binding MarR family transcriptional regulator
MSSPNSKKGRRRELLNRLRDLGRRISTETVFLHQAIAQSVGLNATDTKCIDLILSHPQGSVTAGGLSVMTGLTTGAITHILDRLEKKQFVERIRDSRDRRKVFVRVRLESLEPLTPKYEEVGRAYMAVAEQYDDKELQLICHYMERASEVSKHELADMLAATGSRASQAKSTRRPGGRESHH